MGQGLSDLFYSDNPNRRSRVNDLQHDLEDMKTDFEELTAELKTIMKRLKPQIDKLMEATGLNSGNIPGDERLKVAAEELEKINELIEGIDDAEHIFGILRDIEKLVAVITGAALFLTVALTSMTASFASVIGFAVGALLLALSVIGAAISGDIERKKMRNAMFSAHRDRIFAKQSLERLRLINHWASEVSRRMDSLVNKLHLSQAEATEKIVELGSMHASLKIEFDKWTPEFSAEKLEERDRERGSWTNEDPTRENSIANINMYLKLEQEERERRMRMRFRRDVSYDEGENNNYTIKKLEMEKQTQKKNFDDPQDPTIKNIKLSPPEGTEVSIPGVVNKNKGINVILREQGKKDQAMVVLKHNGSFLSVRDGALGKWDDSVPAERQIIVKVVKVNEDSMVVRLRLKANNKFISHLDGRETDDKELGVWIAKPMKAA